MLDSSLDPIFSNISIYKLYTMGHSFVVVVVVVLFFIYATLQSSFCPQRDTEPHCRIGTSRK